MAHVIERASACSIVRVNIDNLRTTRSKRTPLHRQRVAACEGRSSQARVLEIFSFGLVFAFGHLCAGCAGRHFAALSPHSLLSLATLPCGSARLGVPSLFCDPTSRRGRAAPLLGRLASEFPGYDTERHSSRDPLSERIPTGEKPGGGCFWAPTRGRTELAQSERRTESPKVGLRAQRLTPAYSRHPHVPISAV